MCCSPPSQKIWTFELQCQNLKTHKKIKNKKEKPTKLSAGGSGVLTIKMNYLEQDDCSQYCFHQKGKSPGRYSIGIFLFFSCKVLQITEASLCSQWNSCAWKLCGFRVRFVCRLKSNSLTGPQTWTFNVFITPSCLTKVVLTPLMWSSQSFFPIQLKRED